MRGGFGGKRGSISSRSIGKQDVSDRAGSSESLIRSIAGDDLMVWIDADDVVGIADGAAVSTWTAKHGNSPSADSGKEAVYKTAGLNNRPSVRFAGTDCLKWAGGQVSAATTTESTMLSTTQTSVSSNAQRTIMEMGLNWYSSDGITQNYGNGNVLAAGIGSGADNDNMEGTVKAAAPDLQNVFVSTYQRSQGGGNATIEMYVNSEPAPPATDTTNETSATTDWPNLVSHLGSRNNGASFSLSGDIREFLLLKRSLTEGEASRISKALMKRSGITRKYSDY